MAIYEPGSGLDIGEVPDRLVAPTSLPFARDITSYQSNKCMKDYVTQKLMQDWKNGQTVWGATLSKIVSRVQALQRFYASFQADSGSSTSEYRGILDTSAADFKKLLLERQEWLNEQKQFPVQMHSEVLAPVYPWDVRGVIYLGDVGNACATLAHFRWKRQAMAEELKKDAVKWTDPFNIIDGLTNLKPLWKREMGISGLIDEIWNTYRQKLITLLEANLPLYEYKVTDGGSSLEVLEEKLCAFPTT